jgi:hypothetical protein
MASSEGRPVLLLSATGLTSNEHALSNAVWVHPADFAKLVDAARADPAVAKDKGVLCAVGEAVFFVRPSDAYKPSTVGVGLMQRLAGQVQNDKPTPVTPFVPRGNFPMASLQLELDVLKAGAASEVCSWRTLHFYLLLASSRL